MKTTGKVLIALGIGVAVGVVAGILFAPEKGSVTREKINSRGKKITDSFKEKFRKAQESVNDFEEA